MSMHSFVDSNLIHAYVISRLDFMNSQLYRIPQYQILKLQHVQNAAAKLVYNGGKYDHVTPLLIELHWFPVKKKGYFSKFWLNLPFC